MNVDEQVRYFMQGTEYGDAELGTRMAGELAERLLSAQREGRKLRVYCGFDPRTSDLHLGHTVPIRKLRQFQELGHEISFLVGTYTSLIGDPSDKSERREIMTREQIRENGRTYVEQACKILDPKKTEVHFNHEWLSELSLGDLIEIGSHFTLGQFLTRENFKLRIRRGAAVYLHETFYALMQSYDACRLKADVQVGGSDQLFNIMTASRKLMTARGMPPNIALIMGILPGTDGEIKMSKSLDNHIPILASPEDMYGKVMSIPDRVVGTYFSMVTELRPCEIDAIMAEMKTGGQHPRDIKMRLAREIVSVFHSQEGAARAEEEFVRIFRRKDSPSNVREYRFAPEETVLDIIAANDLVQTRSEGRRLIRQRAVRLEGKIVTDPQTLPECDGILRVGRRKFLRLVARV